jgi:hypothetical protein
MSKSSIKVVDHGWKALMDRAKLLSGDMHVKVGVLADSKAGGLHQKDSEGNAKPLTVAEIAAIQEFGTKDGVIPSRPFIRSTFDRMRNEVQRDLDKLAAEVLFGEKTPKAALDWIGLKVSAAMKKTVTTGSEVPPPNAPATKARKERRGRNSKWGVRTLVDTGRMVGAITWAVITKKSGMDVVVKKGGHGGGHE